MELVGLDSSGERAGAALSPALSWKADPGDPGPQDGRRAAGYTACSVSPGFVETPLLQVHCPSGAKPGFVTY